MKTKLITVFLVAVFLAVGCSHTPAPQNVTYVEAAKIPVPERQPTVVKVSEPMPLPGQLKRLPSNKPDTKPSKKVEPWQVIEKNNRAASQNPNDFGYFNSIMQYDFALGALYQVYCAPLKLTDIQLQPGEKILGKPAAGDTVRWVMGLGKSMGPGGVEQQHLYIKPTRPKLHTTLSINTDRRTYHIELHSYQDTYMAAVNWRYPHDEIAMIEQQARLDDEKETLVTSPVVSIDKLNFAYEVKVKQGKRPKWLPVKVFDDGRKVFIQFPKEMLVREAPALFVLSDSDDQTQLVNYRVKNEYYVVDRLFERAELRVGQKQQIIVRISRIDKKPFLQSKN